MVKLYAIRHKPTSNYLPARKGRGGSHDEPKPTTEAMPRLFFTERSAKSALSAWLQGKWRVETSRSYDGWGLDDDVTLVVDAQPHRKADDMEVVVFNLTGAKKYFLDTDDDSHWYMIPADKREEWLIWHDLPEVDEEPDFAVRLNGHPNFVEFYL